VTDTRSDALSEIEAFADQASVLIPHRFEILTALADGTPIPPEALSEDHSLGLYRGVLPNKMRQNLAGYRPIEVADLLPQLATERTPTGLRADWYLEYVPLRGVRFRTERLQYLEEGWWAVTSEVKYPAQTVLALLHLLKQCYGTAHLLVNAELPMPLWLRPAPLGQEGGGVEAVVQARGEGRVLPTNIHTECPMEYARRWAEAARSYYRILEGS
jgi:hypothetical protein